MRFIVFFQGWNPTLVTLSALSALVVEKTVYGTDATKNNIGQIAEQYDQSGKQQIKTYDFKGNPMQTTKKFAQEYKNYFSWDDATIQQFNNLTIEQFNQSHTYDALNRPLTQKMPDNSIIEHTYNEAGLLETVKKDTETYVSNINYNEKGQRTAIYYGNGSKTKYEYDPNTFRLTRLLTTRNNGIDILQDISYIYDPVGNIVEMNDAAQQTHYFSNSVVEPKGQYEYDALYRLKKATGRELAGLQLPTHDDFVNNLGLPNTSSNAMQNFEQQYTYDELGNILQMKSAGQWTRDYFYNTNDNKLLGHSDGTTEYTYDAHGNILTMPHLTSMQWDHKDQLMSAGNGTFTSYYVYDASGNRARKVVEKGSVIEERFYVGGYEIYRKTTNGTLDVERETVHISDDQKRIAMVDDDGTTETIRYQIDNHLGSASLELDQNAATISYEEYHPFGTTSYRSGRSETEVSLKRYKYVGKERDEETGLYYYGARYYAAWIARFVSTDPMAGERSWVNPYNYCQNNPINRIDPTGALDEGDEEQKSPPPFMMYETAKHGGLLPTDARPKSSVDQVGNYKIFPYYTESSDGEWNLSHYTAAREIPIGQDGEKRLREEWVIRKDSLELFKEKENRWYYPIQRPSLVANAVYSGGFEDFEKELQLGNYGKGILGYSVSQWTNPVKVVSYLHAGIMKIEAFHRAKVPGNIHTDKQGIHVEGSHNYIKESGRSVLTVEAQSLLDKFKKGKGQIISMPKKGQINVDFKRTIGDYYNSKRQYVGPTTRGSIRYRIGKKSYLGSHIVPQKPK